MFLMGSTDCFVNWINLMEMSDERNFRGLIMGPIPRFLWIMLLVFTLIGSVLYVLESINTFTVFCVKDGQTKFPIVWEQVFVLTLEHIPLTAVNFFIAQCRSQYFTTMQTLSGSIYILYIFTRLIWHAHMEGRLIRDDKDFKIRKGMFMVICALYSVAMAFPVMCWRFGYDSSLFREHVTDVNLYLLKAPFLATRNIQTYDLAPLLLSQGRDLNHPYVFRGIQNIIYSETDYQEGFYQCQDGLNVTFIMPLCNQDKNGKIKLKFQYKPKAILPYGEIQYNYAFILSKHDKCVPSTEDFTDNWKLFYLRTATHPSDGTQAYMSSPWVKTCTAPQPWYNPDIPVCT